MRQRDMHSRVEDALDKVRPALRADGGDARVVDCDEKNGSVSIQMLGACKGCPLSQLDLSTPSKVSSGARCPKCRRYSRCSISARALSGACQQVSISAIAMASPC
jgi:hypothetical protein